MTHSFPTRRSSDRLRADLLADDLHALEEWRGDASTGDGEPHEREQVAWLHPEFIAEGAHTLFEGCRLERVERVRDLGRSEEHTSELQSLMRISYAVFCLTQQTQPTHLSAPL